jgi:glycoside/pentoside/hexuronide:cation symporter, GPH family
VDDEVARASLRAVPVSVALKGAYAAGATLDLGVNAIINMFLLFYATNVCGLSAALAGTAMALGLIVDAIGDPLIGSLSDNHHSRWGRRLPFMIVATPILMISFVALFSLPKVSGQMTLFALLTLSGIAVRVSLSLFNLPYMAVAAEISDDEVERSRIVAVRLATGVFATMIAVVLGFSVFFKGSGGIAQRQEYSLFAMSLSAGMLVCALLAMLAVFRTLPRQHPPPSAKAVSAAHLLPELRELMHSRSFRALFGATLLFTTAQGVAQSLGLHANTFFWRLTNEQIQLSFVGYAVGLIVGAPLAGPIIARMQLRTAALVGLSGLVLTQSVPAALRLTGVMTLQHQPLALILASTSFIGGAMTTIALIALLSMMADAVDEHELLFRARREGLYFASWSFAGKAASGLGTFLSGLALHAIHFPIDQTKQVGVNTVLPEHMTNALGFCYGPGAAVLSTLALVVLLLGYKLDRQRHEWTLAQLKLRRAG